MLEVIKNAMLEAMPRDLFIDLEDMTASRALAAFEMVRDHAGLDEKRARELVGQARFRMLEKGFQEVCQLHNGTPLEGGLIPGTNLRAFQPFMRFQGSSRGIILGLASMRARGELPHKNQSREAGVTLNYYLTPRLDFDGTGPKPGDIFVLFLVARDPARVGKIDEIAIGIVDSEYKSYLLYEPLEDFMAGYANMTPDSPMPPTPDGGSPIPPSPLVTLKPSTKVYKPPEEPDGDADETDSSPA